MVGAASSHVLGITEGAALMPTKYGRSYVYDYKGVNPRHYSVPAGERQFYFA